MTLLDETPLRVSLTTREPRLCRLCPVSKRTSGSPFAKSKGRVESVAFHPNKPLFFVATQRHVRVYHLLKQELTKKLAPSVKWISSVAVHPGGDNLLLGSYDKRLCWFDMDLSASPYKTMRSHSLAVRAVAYHPRLPLFASVPMAVAYAAASAALGLEVE